MIEPQEIKIGNYISDLDGNIIKVEELTICASYTTKKRINNLPFDYYKPIPLTEEILLKFGFLKDDNFYHLNNIWISNFYENYFSLDGFDETKIEYIHQLQNIYFALKDEELKFKDIIDEH